MLNDATCFEHRYIALGYTDLRSGIDRLVAIIKMTLILILMIGGVYFSFVAEGLIVLRLSCLRKMESFFFISVFQTENTSGHGQHLRYRK